MKLRKHNKKRLLHILDNHDKNTKFCDVATGLTLKVVDEWFSFPTSLATSTIAADFTTCNHNADHEEVAVCDFNWFFILH